MSWLLSGLSQDEPQRLLTSTDETSKETQTVHPIWQNSEDARAVVAAVSDDTLVLIETRKQEPAV